MEYWQYHVHVFYLVSTIRASWKYMYWEWAVCVRSMGKCTIQLLQLTLCKWLLLVDCLWVYPNNYLINRQYIKVWRRVFGWTSKISDCTRYLDAPHTHVHQISYIDCYSCHNNPHSFDSNEDDDNNNNDVIRRSADYNTASSDGNQFRDDKYFASADMYIHAKNPERVQSEWLRYVVVWMNIVYTMFRSA